MQLRDSPIKPDMLVAQSICEHIAQCAIYVSIAVPVIVIRQSVVSLAVAFDDPGTPYQQIYTPHISDLLLDFHWDLEVLEEQPHASFAARLSTSSKEPQRLLAVFRQRTY